jgi:hypothetical protein
MILPLKTLGLYRAPANAPPDIDIPLPIKAIHRHQIVRLKVVLPKKF